MRKSMVTKGFKPPRLLNSTAPSNNDDQEEQTKKEKSTSILKKEQGNNQQTKKEVISSQSSNDPSTPSQISQETKILTPAKKTFQTPLIKSSPSSSSSSKNSTQTTQSEPSTFWGVMWCKVSTKKHKTYSDGILKVCIHTNTCTLKDLEGKDLAKTSSQPHKLLSSLHEGSTLSFGQKEMEISKAISEEEFTSGRIFMPTVTTSKPAISLKTNTTMKKFKSHASAEEASVVQVLIPRHNPDADGALVLFQPTSQGSGKQQVAVVVDPHIASELRPHQRTGVKFMWDCISGQKLGQEYQGCILADQMGLGKTLQAIALIWTAIKQGPFGTPLSKKVIVITPASLIQNWANEIKHWLGSARLKPVSISDTTKKAKEVLEDFVIDKVNPLLLITYETFVKYHKILYKLDCGLLICDEGHRLKNGSSKTSMIIAKTQTRRKIILSGTPIQNDLDEFYYMVNFCNPGILGSLPSFKRNFGQAIISGRCKDATSEERKISELRSKELFKTTAQFILRRLSTILEKYLPPKVEEIVFCKLTSLQLSLYRHFLSSKVTRAIYSGQNIDALGCITSLKKLCNDPHLIFKDAQNSNAGLSGFSKSTHLFPDDFKENTYQPEYSGKLFVLDSLLKQIRATNPKERVVLVSHYTQTLDIFELMSKSCNFPFLRLDGQLPPDQRQRLVDQFNDPTYKVFLFLLSSKAGGVGLNLIGASRIILYDIDWNPATDHQSMSRVWRDGQTNKVHIYRFLSVGSIEEKIYQRQIMKVGLSSQVVDKDDEENVGVENHKKRFSLEELKDIFSLGDNTSCDTHDKINCKCKGKPGGSSNSKEKASQVSSWDHLKNPCDFVDPILSEATLSNQLPITFVFTNDTEKKKEPTSEASGSGSNNSGGELENCFKVDEEVDIGDLNFDFEEGEAEGETSKRENEESEGENENENENEEDEENKDGNEDEEEEEKKSILAELENDENENENEVEGLKVNKKRKRKNLNDINDEEEEPASESSSSKNNRSSSFQFDGSLGSLELESD